MQAIKKGSLDEVGKWFDEHKKRNPDYFDVNKIVDTRDGEEKMDKNNTLDVELNQMTSLNYAAFYGRWEIIEFLLERGAGESVNSVKCANVDSVYSGARNATSNTLTVYTVCYFIGHAWTH